jgi:hypothetical protein
MSTLSQEKHGTGNTPNATKVTGSFSWQLVYYFEADAFITEWKEDKKHWHIFAAKGNYTTSGYGEFTLQIPAASEHAAITNQKFTVANDGLKMAGKVSTTDQYGEVNVKSYDLEGAATITIDPAKKTFMGETEFRTIVSNPGDPDYAGKGSFSLNG